MTTKSCPKCSLLMARCDFKYCPDCGAQLDSPGPSETPSSETPETDALMRENGRAIAQCKTRPPIWEKMQTMERQRNIAVAELRRIQNTYGHKSEPGCGCEDCHQIRPIEDALRSVESLEGLDATSCPTWIAADSAPKDGTIILGDFGWPWAVPSIWDPVTEEWATAQLSPCAPDESVGWETEWQPQKNLKSWMPFPSLPNVTTEAREK